MKVTFETAAFADAIRKAALVAPATGMAFDKANGIVLDLDASMQNGWAVLIRSTNLDVFRMEWLDPETIEGLPTRWRLPAALFAKFVSTLPIASGQTVELEEHVSGLQKFIRVTQGRTKARFNLIDSGYYPDWPIFDPSQLTEALDVGGRIGQVEWAADSGNSPPWSGVHFNGELAIASDRYRLACVPMPVPGLTEPITVPSGLLGPLLKATGEIRIGVSGGQLLLMPDDSIQIRCVLYGQEFPATDRIRSNTYPESITLKKTPLLDVLNRCASYAASDRDAVMRVFIGEEEIAVFMSNQEVGTIGDAIDISGQAIHDRFEIKFTPKNLIEPLTNSPSEEVIISYDRSNPDRIVRIDGGSGYYAWTMPRRASRPDATT